LQKPLFRSDIINTLNEYVNMGRVEEKQADGKEDDFSGFRILLVEDVEINREIVIALLEPTNLTIDTAENGLVALKKVRESPEPYDMIFMDVQMPELDGYGATRKIRAFESGRIAEKSMGVPIIAMTANVFREDIEKCLEAGMNDHIGKPVNFEDVLQKLRLYLHRKN
jgi:CheY-like chemotaxis protein